MSTQDMDEQDIGTREIRINPIVPTESVLIATARSMRPQKAEEAAPRDTRKHVERCPFCTGNEEKTPPEITRTPADGEWEIRIVENLYPVLGDDRTNPDMIFGLQQAINGYGRHEVVVDHSQHGIAINEMSSSHLSKLFQTYQSRMQQLYESDERLKYVLVFKNFGPAAGASMAHTHSQIIATPVIPQNVQDEVEHSKKYYEKHHHCIFCTMVNEALTYEATIYDRDSGKVVRKIDVGQYVVERGEHFIAIKPFASRYEWEVHIFPLNHQADFIDCSDEYLDDFAGLLQRTMKRLDNVLEGVQYNYFMHTLPHGDEYKKNGLSYHWHLEITPRTSIPTGFELGSGLFVNTISPEEVAQQLRDVEL